MNIALITSYLPSDSKMGVGYQVHSLANQLVRRGHTVTVFSRSPLPMDAEYKVRQFELRPPLRSLRFGWQLRSVDWSKFDVLHAHGDDWFLWGQDVPPHVRTVHGSCLSEARHIPGLKNKLYMCWLACLETMSVAVADRTLGVSANTCRSYPWIREFISNGVDLGVFYPSAEKELLPTILFVGTYHNRKRGKLLMDTFKERVRPAVPDAKLWMVCNDAPVADGVRIFERPSNHELANLYRRAWVFCLPSTYEGFGIPYIEAMASGTPVVASDNLGAREVLDGGKYGKIATDEELGRTLVTLLQNAAMSKQMTDLGLERAMIYGIDHVVETYERLYEEVIFRSQRGINRQRYCVSQTIE